MKFSYLQTEAIRLFILASELAFLFNACEPLACTPCRHAFRAADEALKAAGLPQEISELALEAGQYDLEFVILECCQRAWEEEPWDYAEKQDPPWFVWQ